MQAVMSSDMSDAGLVPDGKLPPGISSVLAVLLSSAVVLDSEDRVLSSSAAAREFGLVENDRLVVGELVALARQVRREGMPREGEIDIMTSRFNGRATSFAVRVAPLGPAVGDGGLILLLAEDQTESRRVDEVRRDFVANISHELKTPVGALALLAETVEEAADDPEAVLRFAGRMRQEAARLTDLVQDLIMLSRIQAAEPVPDPNPVVLDDVVAEAVDRCRMRASARGISLEVTGERGITIMGDEDLLVTALRNLLENAVAYSPDKTRVLITTRAESSWMAEVSVTDQGIGIPERDRERIFERFYRVDPARSRATGGTGLGLAIVKHVTAAHGGNVAVWSQEGNGSTFIAPAAASPAARHAGRHDGRTSSANGPPGRAICQGGSQVTRVLVVEDEESFSDALSYMLRKEGFEVAVCPTGPDAIETFDRTGADLVLLDLMLPGLPGSEVCRIAARALQRSGHHADRQGQRDRQGRGPGTRRGRLRDQAVLLEGARRQDARGTRRRGDVDEPISSIMESGPVRMDVDRHVVTVRSQQVQLPLKEFELLEVLLRNAGRVLTRMQLIDRVWGADYVGDTKTLDVHVKRLRAKIETEPTSPRHIVTVRGLGYKFEPVG